MKKVVVTVVAAVLLLSSSLSVSAAGLKDVFSAKYYADQYPDLYDAFGYDEEALWNHFMTYGLNEGRNMSPVLDVQLYRETYADLDAAFGDNWDAYVEHYFTYGAKEHRDNGTNFDVLTYLEAYDDLEEAFGDDYAAAVEHYLEFGMEEGRDKGDPVVYQASIAPVATPTPTNNPSTDIPASEPDSDTGASEDGDMVYDENGKLIKETLYDIDGSMLGYYLYEYDEAGRLIKKAFYMPDDSLNRITEITEYNDKDWIIKETVTFNGKVFDYINEYDDNGVLIKQTETDRNTQVCTVYEYDQSEIVKITKMTNGTITQVTEYFTAEDGSRCHTVTYYQADGSYITYFYDADWTILLRKDYDAAGNNILIMENKYDAEGTLSEQYYKHLDTGYSEIYIFGSDGKKVRENFYDENGNLTNYFIFEYSYYEDGYSETGKFYRATDDVMESYYVFQFDNAGNSISTKYYNPDGTEK